MHLLCVFRAADLGNVCYLCIYNFLRQYCSVAMEVPSAVDEAMLTVVQCTNYIASLTKAACNHFGMYTDFTTAHFPIDISSVIYGRSCMKTDIIGSHIQECNSLLCRKEQSRSEIYLHLHSSAYFFTCY